MNWDEHDQAVARTVKVISPRSLRCEYSYIGESVCKDRMAEKWAPFHRSVGYPAAVCSQCFEVMNWGSVCKKRGITQQDLQDSVAKKGYYAMFRFPNTTSYDERFIKI